VEPKGSFWEIVPFLVEGQDAGSVLQDKGMSRWKISISGLRKNQAAGNCQNWDRGRWDGGKKVSMRER